MYCSIMSMLCISVVLDGQSIIPWTICSIQPGQTFWGLYQQICAGSIECFQGSASRWQLSKLAQAFVGKTTDSLVAVDGHLPMDDVCKQFGSYVRLKCEKVGEPQTERTAESVFRTMMMNQRELDKQERLPVRIESPRTNKDRLFNDLIALFDEKKWTWHDGGRTLGKNVISSLCDTLWYIDGHHSTLEVRSGSIPAPFDRFDGYNVPERSKHRKRKSSNRSSTILQRKKILKTAMNITLYVLHVLHVPASKKKSTSESHD